MSMLPVVSALSTMAVLPSPWLCAAAASPAACADCLMISPRMYDSVKRLEPTFRVGAAIAEVAREHASNNGIAVRSGMKKMLMLGSFADRLRESANSRRGARSRWLEGRERDPDSCHPMVERSAKQ